MALLMPLTLMAQPYTGTSGYSISFDPATVRARTDRQLSAVSLSGTTLTLPSPTLMYNYIDSQMFTCRAGDTVWPAFGYTGRWMQGYIYIDLNGNGTFDTATPGAHGSLGAGNELMAFAGMNLEGGAYNSAGEALADLSAVQPPSFTVPDSLAPGLYMMRWKVDWDSCDPAGRADEANSITRNGGAVVDVWLCVTDDDTTHDGYQLVFSDEFDLPDGSQPDPTRWTASQRQGAVWNRWISPSPDVAFTRDGRLVCRAMPNPDTATDDVPMLTGAVETRNKFAFTYGRVEVRLRTNLHTGNFPAAWMMPQPPCAAWPAAGEIDIFECLDSENRTYHTVHSHWTYDLNHKSDPASSFNTPVYVSQWHVYGLEWTPEQLTWSIDGRTVGTYARSASSAVLEQGQWPFDHPFYIILNQSVGNGSWAKEADTAFTYETEFDWVRVYQHTTDGITPAATHETRTAATHDLMGRKVDGSRLRPGIYIHDGRKVLVGRKNNRP